MAKEKNGGMLTKMTKQLCFYDALKIGTNTFYSALGYNGLFFRDHNNKQAIFLDNFYGNRLTEPLLHRKIIKCGENVFFIPYRANGISYFSLHSKKLNYIPLFENELCGFSGIIQFDEYTLLIPSLLDHSFYILDGKKAVVKCDERFKDIMNSVKINQTIKWCDAFGVCQINDNTIIIALAETDVLVQIDLNSLSCKLINVENFCLANIFWWDNRLWATSWKGNLILSLDLEDNAQKLYTVNEENNCERPFFEFASHGDKLFLLPCQGTWIWKYNKSIDKWEKYINPYLVEGFKRVLPNTLFFGWEIDAEYLMLYPRSGNGIIKINVNKGNAELINIEMSEDSLKRVLCRIKEEENVLVNTAIQKQGVINEDLYDFTLNKFLNCVFVNK